MRLFCPQSDWVRHVSLAAAALLFAAHLAGAQTGVWVPLGPRAVTVFTFERDPLNPAVLYVGTYFGGLYRSQDRGATWAPIPSQFSAASVFALARVPEIGGRMYVGTLDQGIFASDDNGATWSAKAGSNVGPIEAIAIDPHQYGTVLASTFNGVLSSRDNGLTWNLSTDAGQAVSAILFDPGNPGFVYLGTNGRGVYVSHDSGVTWSPFNDGMGQKVVTRFEFDLANPGLVLASTGEGVFRSRADGTGWDNLTYDLPVQLVTQTVRDATTGDLFAATDTGVYRMPAGPLHHWVRWTEEGARFVLIDPTGLLIHVASTTGSLKVTGDNGVTFWPSDFGIQNRFVESLTTVNAFGQTVIYAATDFHGVAYTAELFRNSRELPWIYAGSTGGGIFHIERHPTVPGTLFMGTEGAGIFKTTDFGSTWTSASNGIVPSGVMGLDQSLVGAHTLYAGTTFGIFASQDNGLTWTPNTDTTPRPVSAVLADPVRPTVAYYGTADGEVLRTFDSGANFDRVWPGTGQGIRKLAGARWGNLYAVNVAGQLYSSNDMGDHFFRRATDIPYEIVTVAVDRERPWVLYVGTVFGGVYKSETDAIEWTQVNSGLDIPVIFTIAIDPSNAATIYAGAVDSVFKSTDAGASWHKLPDGLPPGSVTDLQVDAADPQTLYASVSNHGVFKTIDGGGHWSLLRDGSPFLGAVPILTSRAAPGVLFAGTQGGGVYRSADAGSTWNPSNRGMSVLIKDIAIDPSHPDTMYAASLADGIFASTDGGASWTPKGLAGRIVYNISIDPSSSQTVYASTPLGFERSTDGGTTWAELGQRMAYVLAVASDPTNRTKVFAGGLGGDLYRSVDSGRTWNKAATGMPVRNVLTLAVDPRTRRVYAGVEGAGVYVGGQDGASWQLTSVESFGSSSVGSLAIDPSNGYFYAGTFGSGLYKSIDEGRNWQKLATNFATSYISSVQIHPVNTNVVFASILSSTNTGAAVYVSEDGGATWNASAAGLTSGSVFSLALHPGNASVMFAAAGDGVYKSTDRGAHWQLAGSGLSNVSVRQLLVDASAGGSATVYAGTAGQGVFRSLDAGATWLPVSTPYNGPTVNQFSVGPGPGLIYVATLGNGVFYGTASGPDLQGGTDPGLSQAVVHQVVVDPGTPTTLYAATGGQGVLKSENGGLTWHRANQGLDYPYLFMLVVDPVQPSTLYAATTGGGVFVSDNGGSSWAPMNVGLFHKVVTCLAFDVNDHRILYAGTEGGGAFRFHR